MEIPIKHLLVPVDGSPGAQRAVAYAGQLARWSGADIVLLHVHRPDPYRVESLAEVPPVGEFQSMAALEARMNDPAQDPVFEEARKVLGKIQPADAQIRWGQPAAVICEYAQANGIDQIVMGARGRSSFAALLLGSVSAQVLQHAHCPVTIVR